MNTIADLSEDQITHRINEIDEKIIFFHNRSKQYPEYSYHCMVMIDDLIAEKYVLIDARNKLHEAV